MAMAVSFSLSAATSQQHLGTKIKTESLAASSSGSFTRLPTARPSLPKLEYESRERSSNRSGSGIQAALTGIDLVTVEEEEVTVPRGASWAVHKFGGTCVGTSERINNVAKIIVGDPSLRKVAVVSAMSKVTDMMYDLLHRAAARDESYLAALENVHTKHKDTAIALLQDGEDLTKFLTVLENDVLNLRAMLRAICIAGHATETFEDWVAGHGELWSAQLLAAAVRKNGLPCVWMDASHVLVVTPSGKQQVDPDYEASEEKLDKWYSPAFFLFFFTP